MGAPADGKGTSATHTKELAMTYGSISPTTETYLKLRAAKENIPWEKINIDPEWDKCENANCGDISIMDEGCEDCDGGEIQPEFLRMVSIIYSGALDEEFYIDDLYSINVCDWLAEQLTLQGNRYGEEWEVILTIPYPENSEVIYTVNNYADSM